DQLRPPGRLGQRAHGGRAAGRARQQPQAEGWHPVMNLITEIAPGGVRGGTSILYAALGETIAERASVIYLGTEGSMLTGALAAYAVTAQSGSPWVGVVAGAAAGGLLALVHAVLVLARGANQLATGFVVLFLGLGLTSLFGAAFVGRQIEA